jgi:hypothetical protein
MSRSRIRTRSVPAYASNGRRLRDYSVEAVERCLALKLCIAKRHRKSGRIASIQFLPPRSSGEPVPKTVHMGQRYSFCERLDDTAYRAWKFSRTLVPRDWAADPEEVERELQKIFRAVALSCFIQR